MAEDRTGRTSGATGNRGVASFVSWREYPAVILRGDGRGC